MNNCQLLRIVRKSHGVRDYCLLPTAQSSLGPSVLGRNQNGPEEAVAVKDTPARHRAPRPCQVPLLPPSLLSKGGKQLLAQELRDKARRAATVAPLWAQSRVPSAAMDSPAHQPSAAVRLRGTPVAALLACGLPGLGCLFAAQGKVWRIQKNNGVPDTGSYRKTTQRTGNAMNAFVRKHAARIAGTLSCFDRVLFKGYLPICSPEGMMAFLSNHGMLMKDFKSFAPKLAGQLKAHAQDLARRLGRPYRYLNGGGIRKEDLVREIIKADPVQQGLVCVLACVEGCRSFRIAYRQERPCLQSARRKCLCLYFYYLDRDFGLMHVRIQTWLPFDIQVCLNGHEWLARKMDRHGLAYRRLDNAFAWLADPSRAQRFADRFTDIDWPRILHVFARRACPVLKGLLASMEYYWVVDQAEYATDIMFKDRASLKGLYQKLLWHATLCFSAEDVLTFLGRKLHGSFAGEVLNDCKKRLPGARIKHRMKGNWIKMYDKDGLVLRIETVINHPYEFKVRRMGKRKGQEVMGWYPMTKGVGAFYRYAEVAAAANRRYIEALAVVDDPADVAGRLTKLCQPATYRDRRRRGLNPLREDDRELFQAVLRGEHAVNGFRNRDIAKHLLAVSSADPSERRRQSAWITRRIQLLRAHGLVAKFPRSRRYRPTRQGLALMAAAIYLQEQTVPELIRRIAS